MVEAIERLWNAGVDHAASMPVIDAKPERGSSDDDIECAIAPLADNLLALGAPGVAVEFANPAKPGVDQSRIPGVGGRNFGDIKHRRPRHVVKRLHDLGSSAGLIGRLCNPIVRFGPQLDRRQAFEIAFGAEQGAQGFE